MATHAARIIRGSGVDPAGAGTEKRGRGELPRALRTSLLVGAAIGLILIVGLRHSLYLGAGVGGDALNLGVLALGALSAFARSVYEVQLARFGWALVGLGISTYSLGSATFFVIQNSTLSHFPTTGDTLWLVGSALILAGFALLLKVTLPGASAVLWVDSLIAAFLVASLGAVALFRGALRGAATSPVVVSGRLSYPAIDLVLLSLAISSYWFGGRRLRWDTALLGTAFATLLATDTIFLHRVAAGRYEPGTLLDTTWLAAMLLIGLAAAGPRAATIHRVPRALPAAAIPLIGAIAAGSLFLETQLPGHEPETRIALVSLAALTLTSVLLRFLLSLHENTRLIEAERTARQAAQGAQTDLAAILEASPTPICVVGPDAIARVWNPAAERCSGYTNAEVIGGPPPVFPAGNDERVAALYGRALSGEHLQGEELKLLHRSGDTIDIRFSTAPLQTPEEGVVILFEDITEQRRQADEISYLASHDTLTKLPNRHTFERELERAIARRRRGQPAALILIDVDNFKQINDTAGHATGDRVLHDLAQGMNGQLRPGDTLARLSGDEFAAIIEHTERSQATRATARLLEAARIYQPPTPPGLIETTVSAGIHLLQPDDTPDSALQRADEALYEAKRQGKNQLRAWSPPVAPLSSEPAQSLNRRRAARGQS